MAQPQFYRDTWVEINLDKLADNIKNIKKTLEKDCDFIAVIKANAYGHGAVQVAKVALENGATHLAVSLLDEALALRKKGITAPIITLGVVRPREIEVAIKNDISVSVFQLEWLQAVQEEMTADQSLRLQLKIDSGMGRIGVRTKEELVKIESLIKSDPRFHLEGVYTHFATADDSDQTYLQNQVARFEELLSNLKERPQLVHSSNSAATLLNKNLQLDAVRVGIAMHGLYPSKYIESHFTNHLKPTFSLHTKLIAVKKVPAGERISYGGIYETEKTEWIGTLPIGYADGWLRALTGQDVLIDGIRCPIVGKICMDQCMVKLPYELAIGTSVTLIGKQKSEEISMEEIAEALQTINYEVSCVISSRVPRIYRKNGRITEVNNSLLQ